MSKVHLARSGFITKAALPSITRQRGTTTGTSNLMLFGAGKTTVANNTTFIDSSTNAFTVTRNGDTVHSGHNPFSTVSDGSAYFDGTGDTLQVVNSTGLQLTNSTAFTIECWVYPTNLTGQRFIIVNYNGSSPYQGYGLAYNVNGLSTIDFWDGNGGSWVNTGITLTLNVWTHIAVTYEGSGTTRRFFKDGIQSGSAGTVPSGINYTAGNLSIGDNFATNYWLGYISNFRVVKGTAVYTSTFTPPTSALTAITNTQLLLLTDNYSIVNSTPTPLPVTINGNTTISTAQYPTGMTRSIYFDGTGDYLDIPNGTHFSFGTGDFTIEMFVYLTATPSVFTFIHGSTATTGNFGFQHYLGSTFFYNIGGSNVSYTLSYTANTWTHLAVVRSGTTLTYYINGTSQGTRTFSNNITTTTGSTRIGAVNTPSDYLQGYISNLRIAKGTAVYTANFTPPSAPLSINISVPANVTNAIYGVNQLA